MAWGLASSHHWYVGTEACLQECLSGFAPHNAAYVWQEAIEGEDATGADDVEAPSIANKAAGDAVDSAAVPVPPAAESLTAAKPEEHDGAKENVPGA